MQLETTCDIMRKAMRIGMWFIVDLWIFFAIDERLMKYEQRYDVKVVSRFHYKKTVPSITWYSLEMCRNHHNTTWSHIYIVYFLRMWDFLPYLVYMRHVVTNRFVLLSIVAAVVIDIVCLSLGVCVCVCLCAAALVNHRSHGGQFESKHAHA